MVDTTDDVKATELDPPDTAEPAVLEAALGPSNSAKASTTSAKCCVYSRMREMAIAWPIAIPTSPMIST